MKRQEWTIYSITVVASASLHLGSFHGIGAAARNAPKEPRVLEFAVVETPPPPPEPEPEPEKPKPPPPKKQDLTKAPPPPPPDTPPPSNTTDEQVVEEAPPVFGISMASTVGPGNSGMRVRVGNTLMKDPEEEFTPPSEVQAYKAVPVYKVNKMPGRIGRCEGPYPARARELGIEGVVRLEVEVLADGSTGEVTVVEGLGYGLDEAAVKALKACKWNPALVAGQPVTTTINYTYRFRVDE